MALGKKSIIALAASCIVLSVGAAIGFNWLADEQARSAYAAANASLKVAEQQNSAANSGLDDARVSALEVHASGAALHEVTDEAMLAEATFKNSLSAALSRVVKTANLDATDSANPAAAATPASQSEQPTGREELHAAAQRVLKQATHLKAQTVLLERQTQRIVSSIDLVHETEVALVGSAYTKATQIEMPELASQESKDAFAAAFAALQQPAPDADLATMVQMYQDTWQAIVISNEEALRARDPASIEPTYIQGILVVNKTYALPSWFGDGLTAETQNGFDQMRAEAASLGLDLYISSGFRSYWSQQSIYNRYVAADGRAEADRYSARPGHSEHQSGLTFDLNTIDEAFAYTAEGQWVRDNAHRFGFVIRYPQGKEHITGYIWEPWHLRYLGVGAATELYNSGLSLEEHLGVTSQYAD